MYLDAGDATLAGGRVQQDAFAWRYVAASEYPEDRYIAAVVCDGVGSGRHSGEIAKSAAEITAATLCAYGPSEPECALHTAREAVLGIHKQAGGNENTCVVAATVDETGTVTGAWVGDCRAYVLTRDGRLALMTRDHNGGPHARTLLTRALIPFDHHGPETSYMPERFTFGATRVTEHQAARLLLTTDGIHDVLTDDQILWVLQQLADPGRAAHTLAAWAVRARDVARTAHPLRYSLGADNATAVVVDLPPQRDADKQR